MQEGASWLFDYLGEPVAEVRLVRRQYTLRAEKIRDFLQELDTASSDLVIGRIEATLDGAKDEEHVYCRTVGKGLFEKCGQFCEDCLAA